MLPVLQEGEEDRQATAAVRGAEPGAAVRGLRGLRGQGAEGRG